MPVTRRNREVRGKIIEIIIIKEIEGQTVGVTYLETDRDTLVEANREILNAIRGKDRETHRLRRTETVLDGSKLIDE